MTHSAARTLTAAGVDGSIMTLSNVVAAAVVPSLQSYGTDLVG
jgi:hypothetical protein